MTGHIPTSRVARRAFIGLVTAVLSMTAAPAFADIFIYWKIWGSTLQVGSVATDTGYVQTEDGGLHSTSKTDGGGESHMAIVCEGGSCGIVGDCTMCHTAPKPARTFNGRVAQNHRRTYFPRATVVVGATPLPFDGGFVQMQSGRMVLLDKDRTPAYRLPGGARLLRDTRTSQPLFIVYDGQTRPEVIRR